MSVSNPFAVPKQILIERLKTFLDLDIGFGDITSGLIPIDARSKAKIIAKSDGIVAGAEEASAIFEYLGVNVVNKELDGQLISKGQSLMELEGSTRQILMGERTALNFLMKLSSIATSTADYVNKLRNKKLKTIIAATRKSTPGFGWFEKKAVVLGGGDPHRWNLSDMVLLKNTHLKFYQGNIEKLLEVTKTQVGFTKKIELEVEQPGDVMRAIKAGADIVMLDNMTPDIIQKTLEQVHKDFPQTHVIFEASGNITMENFERYAQTGVDVLSTSQLIFHPHGHMDFSLRLM